MSQSINNPVAWSDIERGMTPAEERFVECVARGVVCKFGDAVPENKKSDKDIRAEVIRFFAFGGDDEHPVGGMSINLFGARVVGELNLNQEHIPYSLGFFRCRFSAAVNMRHAKCAALYLNGTLLAKGLQGDGLQTDGNVFLRNGFSAEGEVRLTGAHIGGNLECNDSKFSNPGGNALSADGIRTGRNVFLRNGFSAEGGVRLAGARIGGNLECDDSKFSNPGGNVLSADGIRTGGDVFLRNGFSAEGEVRLAGARIGGNLECDDSKFSNPGGNALSADGIRTEGDVFLHNGFSAEGEVRLAGARIGGNLECDDSKFSNPGGNALSADGIRIEGDVFLRNGFSAEGGVRLAGAYIGGDLDCEGGNFSNPGKRAIIAQNVKINDALLWRNTTCSGVVDFTSGMAGVLVDDVDKQPAKPLYQMGLEGFTYKRFSFPGNVQSRFRWLANRPENEKFSPLPYEQAASVLFAMGHDDNAREILLRKEREQTKASPLSVEKVFRKGWGMFADYGYRLRKILLWSALVFLFGAGIFYCADQSGHIIPHQPVVLVNSQYLACCDSSERPTEAVARLFPDYPRFNAIVFSADVFIPFFALHQEPYWHPATDKDFISGLILWWYRAEIFFGWVLTSLFLLSITGLLRPRQHSGKG